jgi:hypothetical protein
VSGFKAFNDERKRIADMLASVDPAFNPDTTRGKAAVMRAILGSVEPEWEMAVICKCGWRGTFNDIAVLRFDTGPESWEMRAARRGYHYPCPKCGEVIWRYYHTIN